MSVNNPKLVAEMLRGLANMIDEAAYERKIDPHADPMFVTAESTEFYRLDSKPFLGPAGSGMLTVSWSNRLDICLAIGLTMAHEKHRDALNQACADAVAEKQPLASDPLPNMPRD